MSPHRPLGVALAVTCLTVSFAAAPATTLAAAPATPAAAAISAVPQAVSTKASPDFDGDGLADFAFGDNYDSHENIELRYGSGAKTTIAPATVGTGDTFLGAKMLARDVNADGFTDLAFPSQTYVTGSASLCVALGSPAGLKANAARCTKIDLGVSRSVSGLALVEAPIPRLVLGTSGFTKQGKLLIFDLDSDGLPTKGYKVAISGKGKVPKVTDSGAFAGELTASGNRLYVGVPGAKVGSAKSAGAVVVLSFAPGGISGGKVITQATKGVAGAAATNNFFGFSVAVGEGYLAVGATQDDVPGAKNSGAVHLFGVDQGKLTPVKRISQSSPGVPGKSEPRDRFGSAVAMGKVCAGVVGVVVGGYGEVIPKGHESDGSAWLVPLRITSKCPARQLWEGHGLGGSPTYGRMLGDQVAFIRDANQASDNVVIVGGGAYSDLSPNGVVAVWSTKTGRGIAYENGLVEGLAGR